MVNQHLKRVTKPQFKLQHHLALEPDIFRKGILYLKIAGPIIFEMVPQEPL